MTRNVLEICLMKYTIVDNVIRTMKKHLFFHLLVFLGVTTILTVAGICFFYIMFHFLMNQEIFGPQLMDSMLSMLMLVFFSMLVFSNLIITLTTTYISKETEFLFSLPLHAREIFSIKLFESIFYSSWAFLLLSFPLVVSFGLTREAPVSYFLFAMLLILPFLIIPSSIGSIVTMILAAFVPAKRMRLMSVVLIAAVLIITLATFRFMGGARLMQIGEGFDINRIQAFLNMGEAPLVPSYWLSEGIIEAAQGRWSFSDKGAFYWMAQLWANAFALLLLADWLVPSLYYRGWCLSRESVSRSKELVRWQLFDKFERCYAFLRRPVRAIVTKDMKTFWRDPAQWSQFIILFGLLVIYILSVRGAYQANLRDVENVLKGWKVLVSFFNLGATCTILSIFTSRFFYPMLSLEGKQYWVIGLAPLERDKLISEKYWLCWIFACFVSEMLMLLSGFMLNIDPFLFSISIGTVFLMSLGLTSLSIGLGAASPNFVEDNPARIANGLGGTLNIIFSISYIGIVIGLMYPSIRYFTGDSNFIFDRFAFLPALSLIIAALINLIVIIAPLHIGIQRWRNMEF
ncbi:hypothetical protein JXA32_04690 [Candidatus Sumerlaeota bacterium]|nr:hypothetical protein [Candidatus Sumerlaeota bacterium]